MARAAATTARTPRATELNETETAIALAGEQDKKDKVLPLPQWLKRVYYVFPIILYIPDVIFNYYVYSDGGSVHSSNPVVQASFTVLWAFLSIGVVGMAYLLSVLAPWHWGQGHRIQAFFCGTGVLIATGITTWNSLAYRSQGFIKFPTDEWVYNLWPQLRGLNFSLTMVLIAIAPPFWGLFWALVQPTETGRTLGQLRESHQERLLRMQQEAELKSLRAEANARVRAAQLKGMAATAAAARDQMKGVLGRKGEEEDGAEDVEGDDERTLGNGPSMGAHGSSEPAEPGKVLKMPTLVPAHDATARGGNMLYNHAPAAVQSVRSGPAAAQSIAQPSLIAESSGVAPRTPPTLGAPFTPQMSIDPTEVDGATGTTGPRPAIRRAEPGLLTRSMNEPNPIHREIVVQAMRERGIKPGKSSLTVKQMDGLAPIVAERINVDESSARSLIKKVMQFEAQHTSRQS